MTGKASFDTLVLQEAFRYLYHKLPMFQFTCPPVESQPELVRICKLCKSEKVVINQTLRKPVKDSVFTEVMVVRLKCKACKYSFRIYPEGIKDYSARTKRLVFLGVILYSAGLSYQKAVGFLNGMLGRELESFVTIWRDVQVIGEKLRRKKRALTLVGKHPSVVVGIDGTYVRVRGKEQPVLMAINAHDGTTITVSLANEWKEKELKQFLKEVAKEFGIAGIITDDLDTYKSASEKHHLPHQVCLAHVKKNIGKRLFKLKTKIPKTYLEIVKGLLDPPQVEGNHLLQGMLKDPKLWKSGKRNKQWVALRGIIGDLLRNWQNYIAFLNHPLGLLPTTNNRTEQAIGRSKVRYKLTRGFKAQSAVLNFFSLTQSVGMKQFDQIALVC